jgi:hypothetical protein
MRAVKSFLWVVIVLLSSSLSFSQSNKINVGIEGGSGLASLRGNLVENADHQSRIGYTGGLTLQYNFKNKISICTGVSYEPKGDRYEANLVNENIDKIGTSEVTSNFDYIIIPLLIRQSFGKKIIGFFNVGGYYGYLLKQTDEYEPVNGFAAIEIQGPEFLKRKDIGISGGAGIAFPLKEKFMISVEVRENLGLTHISKGPDWSEGRLETNSINLLVGFIYKPGMFKQASE